MPGIIQMLIDSALNGDISAANSLLSRCVPVLKAEALPVNLSVKERLPDQGKEIIKATMGGRIPPDIASQLLTGLAAQAKLIEVDDLLKRVEALEGKR